jgi:uncharacterized protein (DUF885 family)
LLPLAPAFTASNTGGPSGEGAGAISGYKISNVSYQLDSANPTQLAAISFSLAPASATTAQIRLSSDGPWYRCTVAMYTATCQTPGQPVTHIAALDVVAA